MVLMMTTMDEIWESEQSRFQFSLVIFNFTLSFRAPPSTKN